MCLSLVQWLWLFSVLNSKNNYYGLYVDKPAHVFNLSNTSGKQINLEKFSGNYVYLMFGFTHCQEVCPLQLSNILAINRLLVEKPVRFLFITLDPDRDSKEILKQYFEVYGEEFMALKPDSFQAAQTLAIKYHEYVYIKGQKSNKQNYEINHNGFIFLLSPDGKLKLIYTSTQLNHSAMFEDLKNLINNT